MSRPADQPATSFARSLYRLMLLAYPRSFRRRFGEDMLEDVERMQKAARRTGAAGRIRSSRRIVADWLRSAARERLRRRGGALGFTRRGAAMPPIHTELRHAARRIRMSAGFSAVVALVVALGTGPTIAVYSIANWILWRPIPGVRQADELAEIWYGQAEDGSFTPTWVSYPDLDEIAARTETLAGIAGMQGGRAPFVLESGAIEVLVVEHVTASYFPVLGLRPEAGRFFTGEEDRLTPGVDPAAVISSRLAGSLFGGAEAAIGRTVQLRDGHLRVIGVLPPGFHGTERLGQVDIWRPGTWQEHAVSRGLDLRSDRSAGGYYKFVARRAPGATWEQATAELAGLNAWLAETWPEENARYTDDAFLVYPGIGLPALGRHLLARTMWLIVAIAASVLAIAVANAAGLLFIRGVSQREEVAIQKALGAGRGRLARQVLIESSMLSGIGAGLGLGIAVVFLRLFSGARLGWMPNALEQVEIDWRAASFAAGVSVVVALAAGLLSTLDALRLDPSRWMSGSSRTVAGSGRSWQAWLGGFQVAVTVPLLVGAMLFGQTLMKLVSVDLGFEPDGLELLAFDVNAFNPVRPPDRATLDELAEGLAARPGVEGVTLATGFPFWATMYTRLRPAGAVEAQVQPRELGVDAAYFDVVGIPLLHGRAFRDDEVLSYEGEAFESVVLSAGLATRLFGSPTGAVGEEVEFDTQERRDRPFRVVGVVGDAHMTDPAGSPDEVVYVPLGPNSLRYGTTFGVRAGPGAASLLQSALEAASRLDAADPVRPMSTIQSVREIVDRGLSERRVLARLFGLLAAVGVLLAAIGLAATAARGVTMRTREIGVRKALGADDRTVLRAVFRGLAVVVTSGAVAGGGLAVLGGRLVQSRLYDVDTGDAVTWAATAVVLLGVVLFAGALPARRAVRIDPASALRHDG